MPDLSGLEHRALPVTLHVAKGGQEVAKYMAEAGEWGLLNFAESSYFNEQGKLQPMFTMTKDGYAFLVGKMTRKGAVENLIKPHMGESQKPNKT